MEEVHVITSDGKVVSVCKSRDIAIELMEMLGRHEYQNLKVKTYQVL